MTEHDRAVKELQIVVEDVLTKGQHTVYFCSEDSFHISWHKTETS